MGKWSGLTKKIVFALYQKALRVIKRSERFGSFREEFSLSLFVEHVDLKIKPLDVR